VDVSAPLYEHGLFGESTSLLVALGIGVAFGWFLERGGMGSATKLAGQFYFKDMAVLKVLFSAVVTTMLGVFWFSKLGWLDLPLVYLPPTYLLPQLVGGLVFGLGFVMGGLCPGTSCVSAATGRRDGLAVVGGMLFGVLLFNETFSLIEPFYRSTPMGQITLPELLGVPFGWVVFGVVLAALAAFRGSEWIESRR